MNLIPTPSFISADIIAVCSFPVPEFMFIATSWNPIFFVNSFSSWIILSLSICVGSCGFIITNFVCFFGL